MRVFRKCCWVVSEGSGSVHVIKNNQSWIACKALLFILFFHKEKSGKILSDKTAKWRKGKERLHTAPLFFFDGVSIFRRSQNWKSWEKKLQNQKYHKWPNKCPPPNKRFSSNKRLLNTVKIVLDPPSLINTSCPIDALLWELLQSTRY